MSLPASYGASGTVPSHISVGDIESELDALQRQKQEVENALKAALHSRRALSPQPTGARIPVFPLKGDERADWEQDIIEDELAKPLFISQEIMDRFAQEDAAAEKRIMADIQTHLHQIEQIRNRLLLRNSMSERRKLVSAHLEERASLAQAGSVYSRSPSRLNGRNGQDNMSVGPPQTVMSFDVNAGLSRLEMLERKIAQIEATLFGRHKPAARTSYEEGRSPQRSSSPPAARSRTPGERSHSPARTSPVKRASAPVKPPHSMTSQQQGKPMHSSSRVGRVSSAIGASPSVSSLPSIIKPNLHNYSLKPQRIRTTPGGPTHRMYAVQQAANPYYPRRDSQSSEVFYDASQVRFGEDGLDTVEEDDYERSMVEKRKQIDHALRQQRQVSLEASISTPALRKTPSHLPQQGSRVNSRMSTTNVRKLPPIQQTSASRPSISTQARPPFRPASSSRQPAGVAPKPSIISRTPAPTPAPARNPQRQAPPSSVSTGLRKPPPQRAPSETRGTRNSVRRPEPSGMNRSASVPARITRPSHAPAPTTTSASKPRPSNTGGGSFSKSTRR